MSRWFIAQVDAEQKDPLRSSYSLWAENEVLSVKSRGMEPTKEQDDPSENELAALKAEVEAFRNVRPASSEAKHTMSEKQSNQTSEELTALKAEVESLKRYWSESKSENHTVNGKQYSLDQPNCKEGKKEELAVAEVAASDMKGSASRSGKHQSINREEERNDELVAIKLKWRP